VDHVIEPAKSGRASCGKCREKMAKGELRFGWWTYNDFAAEERHRWYHLKCGAQARPAEFRKAYLQCTAEIEDRDAIDALLVKHLKGTYPYAERAPSGRSGCLSCGDKIAKGTLRIAVETEVDTGNFVAKRPGYLHVGCGASWIGGEDLFDDLEANSPRLNDDDRDALEAGL